MARFPFAAVLLASMLVFGLSGCATLGVRAHDRQAIAGKTYVLTGASSGFGRGVAVRLGQNGANVVLAARRTALLETVAAEVRAAGGVPLVVTADVSKPEDVERLATAATERFGRVDVWINNAGIGSVGLFWDVPVADYSQLVDVNFKGVIYGSHAAMRLFNAQGAGVLINIGSIDSEVPLAYQSVYASTKAAVLSLGRSLNEEIRLSGRGRSIKVATVMPWAADTPWWVNAANYSGKAPRMLGMDDPWMVADAIVRASLYPREEMPVGWKARAVDISHHLAPDLTETISAKIQRAELEKASPAPNSSGALYAPTQPRQGVEGGARDRMRAEDTAAKR
jgi:short-subunit dehydrogenase